MTWALFSGSTILFILGLINLFSESDLIGGIVLTNSGIYFLLLAVLYELVQQRKK